jgi:hypothetical protein
LGMILCMFRTVFPSIIRRSRLHTATGICQTDTAVCLLASRQHLVLLSEKYYDARPYESQKSNKVPLESGREGFAAFYASNFHWVMR